MTDIVGKLAAEDHPTAPNGRDAEVLPRASGMCIRDSRQRGEQSGRQCLPAHQGQHARPRRQRPDRGDPPPRAQGSSRGGHRHSPIGRPSPSPSGDPVHRGCGPAASVSPGRAGRARPAALGRPGASQPSRSGRYPPIADHHIRQASHPSRVIRVIEKSPKPEATAPFRRDLPPRYCPAASRLPQQISRRHDGAALRSAPAAPRTPIPRRPLFNS